MVAIKDAVDSAITFAQSVLPSDRTVGLRLEEVESEKVNGEDVWMITLSMIRPNLLGASILAGGPRDYKTFRIHAETGKVLSMKIRELAGAE